ncbi:MAG: TIGR04086 family membrane protein [Clostridia bacterium]|nr:TIGR04086 family membrane protein [Clostridia bacterium]MDE7328643.1 TIGR04086 family membrane protein [Clostridia bacterium]
MSLKLNKRDFFEIFKGVLFSVIISLLAVIIFAVVVKFANLSQKAVQIVNIFLRIISIFFGTLLAIKSGKQGLFKGSVIGLLFILISYLVFSLINGSFAVNPLTAFDIIFCLAAGLLSGIFTVNVRKNKTE